MRNLGGVRNSSELLRIGLVLRGLCCTKLVGLYRTILGGTVRFLTLQPWPIMSLGVGLVYVLITLRQPSESLTGPPTLSNTHTAIRSLFHRHRSSTNRHQGMFTSPFSSRLIWTGLDSGPCPVQFRRYRYANMNAPYSIASASISTHQCQNPDR